MPRSGALIIVMALALVGCDSLPHTPSLFDKGVTRATTTRAVIGGLALSTPPLTNVIFGCADEFAMPDSLRANCDLHYRLLGKQSPWQQTATAAQAATPAMADLYCSRTLGGKAECVSLSRPQPPLLRTSNMGSN